MGRTVIGVEGPPVARHSLTWRDFRAALASEPPTHRILYRGQPDAALGLVPSLFRLTHRPSLDRYLKELLPEVHRTVGPYLEDELELERPPHLERFLALLRAHDFPAPLLDWTQSADVAGYFAFADGAPSDGRPVTIWKLTVDHGRRANARPALAVVSPHPSDNRTLLSQRGLHTLSLTEEPLDVALATRDASNGGPAPLERYDFSAGEAAEVLADLARRGIHAGTLFLSGDAACRRLAQELAFERQRLGL